MNISSLTKRWPAGRSHGSHRHSILLRALAALSGGGAALMLAAAPAGAQATAAPPQPGVTLSVAGEGNERVDLFYTGTDRQVWMVHMSPMGENIPESLGGQLIGGPGALWIPPGTIPISGLAVFARGADNALWWRHQTSSGWSGWASLGGKLTSEPSATVGGPNVPGAVLVFARGTDGAVWARAMHGDTKGGVVWTSWTNLGGRLLAGTGPAAASNDSGLFVAAVGTDGAVWVHVTQVIQPVTRWRSIGGKTTASPGIATPSGTVAVAFVRGTDSAGWYKRFFGRTTVVPAWQPLGGTLTSGMTALTQQEGSTFGPTSVFALGSDGKPWMNSGTWPDLSGWAPVRIG